MTLHHLPDTDDILRKLRALLMTKCVPSLRRKAVELLAPGARIHGASGSRSTDDGHEGHDGASTPPVIDLVQYFKTVLDS